MLSKAKQIFKSVQLKNLNTFSPPPVRKIEMFINDQPVQVQANLTIFQACKENGITIPRFCYHERLKIAGNCRMCLVQVAKSPKPVASCCSQVAPAMRVYTQSETTRLARGGVMQFLLANHPLDCPICDQGGQCDLQNNSNEYGYRASRHHQFKRAVQDKDFGPLVITHMNRCIHCTRCIRFAQQVAGFNDLGTSGRGRGTQIGTYVEKMLISELSGNLHDVCPVGALNNGPFAYTSRPYQLLSKQSIDVMDSLGSNVLIDYKDNTIMRINPVVNQQINQQWLADKSRQAFDGLKRKRLNTPLIRNGENFRQHTWDEVFYYITEKIQNVEGDQISGGIGQFADIESITAFKDFLNSLDCYNYEFRNQNNIPLDPVFRTNYLFNSRIQGIQDTDLILLVGVNPRTEAPLLNSRILKASRKNTKIFNVGNPADLTYNYKHLGNNAGILKQISAGTHAIVNDLKNAKFPLLILGRDALVREDGEAVLQEVKKITNQFNFINKKTGWNGFNILHRHQGEINALQLGISLKKNISHPKVLFLLGSDNNISKQDIPKDCFVVYIGTHGDEGAQYADVILPTTAYTQKSGTFVNTQGRVQITSKIVQPPGHAREEWEILRALSQQVGVTLPYNSLQQLRERIFHLNPHLLKYNNIESSVFGKIGNLDARKPHSQIHNTPLSDLIDNYYMTDAISRASLVMAKCSTSFNPIKFNNFRKIGN